MRLLSGHTSILPRNASNFTRSHVHCVHEKTVTLYTVRCHTSGKQRQILTKFYTNTETLNCKTGHQISAKIG